MRSVFVLTIRQLSGWRRLAIMAVLAALPVIFTLLLLAEGGETVREFESIVLGGMLAGSIIPLVVLAIAAAAFGNEVEDRTLANLTISPVPRWKIALPKLLATIAVAGPFIALSALATAHFAFLGDATATMAVTVAALAGVAMYAAVFVCLGLLSPQAIGIGLLYIVLWEGLLSGFVAGVRLLSIRFYSVALMHGLDERRFAGSEHLSLPVVLTLIAIVIGGSLLLSIRRLRTMDVP
jgi:ABC-2 type transport system permease protein